MRLDTIDKAVFGVLNVREPLNFAPGLNLVTGHNQAGKSSLLTAIEWLLYGVPPRETKRNLKAVEEWTPWDGSAPSICMTLAPELSGWPQSLRAEASLADFALHLTDTSTLQRRDDLAQVQRRGDWDLGNQLTGLQRRTLTASLMAHQGRLEDLLYQDELRKLLTADLAELVENPERATLDAALKQLEKPKFTYEDLSRDPVLIASMLRTAQAQASEAGVQRERLEQEYQALAVLLAQREAAEIELAAQQRELLALKSRSSDIELAVAAYLHRQLQSAKRQAEEWERKVEAEPCLRSFPATLIADVEHWIGEHGALTDEARRRQQRADQLRGSRDQAATRVQGHDAYFDQLAHLGALQQIKSELAAAAKDVAEAEKSVRRHGEAAEPATRARFEQVSARLTAYDSLPAVIDWWQRRHQQAIKRRTFAERKAAVRAIAKPWPAALFVGAALVLGAAGVFFGLATGLPDLVMRGGLGLILAALGFWQLAQGLKQRRVAVKALAELSELDRGLAELDGVDAEHRLTEQRLRAQISADDTTWRSVLNDLPVYLELVPLLQGYAAALRDRDAAASRGSIGWSSVRSQCPDAPEQPDAEWLARRIALLEQVADMRRELANAEANLKEAELEMTRAGRDISTRAERLSHTLAPIGLADQALANPQSAIRAARQLAQEAARYAEVQAEAAQAAERVTQLALPTDEFERVWSGLSPAKRQALESAIADERACEQVFSQMRSAQQRIVVLEQELRPADEKVRRLREDTVKHEDAPHQLELARQAEYSATERLRVVQRWADALDILGTQLRALASELGGNLAPAINTQLDHLLKRAPVPGVLDAKVNSGLELNLHVSGAPSSLSGIALLSRLSTGAQRQLALVLRIAVAQAMGSARSVPLILDEPLVELDDERAVDCLRYLALLATDRQVILTTCHRTHHQWLLEKAGVEANVIELTQTRAQVASV